MSELEQIRRAAGLSQRELAELSGVAQPNIAAYESGRRIPSAKMLARLRASATPKPSLLLKGRRREIRDIARRHKALKVSVFGSVARGDDHPGSDIDLLVRFAPGASLFDQVALAQDLEDALGFHVDVVSEGGLRKVHERIKAEAQPL
jgi:predicted nucleotidyltransferase